MSRALALPIPTEDEFDIFLATQKATRLALKVHYASGVEVVKCTTACGLLITVQVELLNPIDDNDSRLLALDPDPSTGSRRPVLVLA